MTSTEQPGPEPGLRRKAESLLQVVEPAARIARTVSGLFGGLALASLVSGVILFLLLFAPFESPSLWKGIGWGAAALLLIAPGAVLGIFRIGLVQLMGLPGEVAASIGNIESAGVSALKSPTSEERKGGQVRRLLWLVRSLVDVRATLLQSQEVAVRVVLLVRLANPIMLVIVLGATTMSGLIAFVSTTWLAVLLINW